MPEKVATKKARLMQLECPPDCGFMVRSHDEKEIYEMARQHAKKIHKMSVTDKELKEMIKSP